MDLRISCFVVLAILPLLLAACSGGGDALSVAKINSPDADGAAAPSLAGAVAAVSDLDFAGFGIIDGKGLTREALKSSELMGCLKGSMDFSGFMGMPESQPTAAETELIISCLIISGLSEGQLDSIFPGPADLIGSKEPMVASAGIGAPESAS